MREMKRSPKVPFSFAKISKRVFKNKIDFINSNKKKRKGEKPNFDKMAKADKL